MGKSKSAQAQAVPEEVSKELELLRGFKDIVAERWGYFLGRRVKRQEMNEHTKKERKQAREIRKEIKDSIPKWIENSNIETFQKKTAELTEAQKKVREKSKPFRTKYLNPLRKAQKYLDTVVIPDALHEITGEALTPRFSLSDWVQEQMETED